MFRKNKNDKVHVVLLDRDDGFDFKNAKTAAGIATYGFGGFELNQRATMKYSYGGSIWELGNELNRRASKPSYIARTIDTSPIQFRINSDGKHEAWVQPISDPEFSKRENLAAEIGRIEGANKLNSIDIVNIGLIVLVMLMGIPALLMGILLGLKEI